MNKIKRIEKAIMNEEKSRKRLLKERAERKWIEENKEINITNYHYYKTKKVLKEFFNGIEWYGTSGRIGGYLLSQVFWIWLLNIFSKFLYTYLINLNIKVNEIQFFNIFWGIYLISFFINILNIISYKKEKI